MDKTPSRPLLEVKDLSIAYKTRKGRVLAVEGLNFQIRSGETLGLVGESGCGKSTVAFAIVGFLGQNGRIPKGHIYFDGDEIVGKPQRELNKIRGDRISVVYQDPMAALNPVVPVGKQLIEVLTAHRSISEKEAWTRCVEMLKKVHMPDAERVMYRYSFQLSGGQQQRVVIAMAMLNSPALLIMDEPTTALDVTVEATVLDLVEELKAEYNTGILFITHNLGVVARVSDKMCVMYAGIGVEQGSAHDIFKNPVHPYTQGLIRCVPKLGRNKEDSVLYPIPGRVPDPADRENEICIFSERCDYAQPECREGRPKYVEIEAEHTVRCFRARDIYKNRISFEEIKKKPELKNGEEQVEKLLNVDNLKVYYEQESKSLASFFGMEKKQFVKAVDDISVNVIKGRTLGVVGESGCGKSTMVKGLIGLEEITGGQARFLNFDLDKPITQRERTVIQEMQMVFQNPDATLNPSYTIGQQIARPIKLFKTVPKKQIRSEVVRLLESVRLNETYFDRYPRQLSGGEKQRVGIARALASRPDLVICDEPVSALDVSVQAAVLNLLLEIQKRFSMSLIFIAHDLSVVRFFSDDVVIMYLGQVMEMGPVEAIYDPPYHPYTEALLSAVPIPDPDAEQGHIRLSGNVPSALNPPEGCRFHPRCPRRHQLSDGGEICAHERPPRRQLENGHFIQCHFSEDELRNMEELTEEDTAVSA